MTTVRYCGKWVSGHIGVEGSKSTPYGSPYLRRMMDLRLSADLISSVRIDVYAFTRCVVIYEGDFFFFQANKAILFSD